MYIKKVKNKVKRLIKNNNRETLFPQIKKQEPLKKSNTLFHVSAFNYSNAGDALLPLTLQDTWGCADSQIKWQNQLVYPEVNLQLINKINKSKGLIIGGGGLFLKDTNANNLSGWQWPCSKELLSKIKVPIVFYAVGYNRFRGQEEFKPVFKENIEAFAEKAIYIGLRNYGSINAVKNYLPSNLHFKLRFQPCMTTFLKQLYKNEINFNNRGKFIAFNAAFDRSYFRFGENIGQILSDIAIVLKDLSALYPIKVYSHMLTDESIIPFLLSYKVKYELVRLNHSHPKKIIEEYVKPALVIGMRGHAQMIPFGCGTPILSIVSHNKMQWFLDDIGKPEWGVDVDNANFKEELKIKSIQALDQLDERSKFIEEKQKEFFCISEQNVKEGLKSMV